MVCSPEWRDEVGLWTGVGLCVGWSEVEKWRKRFCRDFVTFVWECLGVGGSMGRGDCADVGLLGRAAERSFGCNGGRATVRWCADG